MVHTDGLPEPGHPSTIKHTATRGHRKDRVAMEPIACRYARGPAVHPRPLPAGGCQGSDLQPGRSAIRPDFRGGATPPPRSRNGQATAIAKHVELISSRFHGVFSMKRGLRSFV